MSRQKRPRTPTGVRSPSVIGEFEAQVAVLCVPSWGTACRRTFCHAIPPSERRIARIVNRWAWGGLDTSRSTAFPLRLRWRARPGGFAGRNSGQNEDGVLPDDGGGGALAGNLGLPGDVRLLAPHHRRIGVGRDSGGERAAPLRPVTIDRGFGPPQSNPVSSTGRSVQEQPMHVSIEVSPRLAAQE